MVGHAIHAQGFNCACAVVCWSNDQTALIKVDDSLRARLPGVSDFGEDFAKIAGERWGQSQFPGSQSYGDGEPSEAEESRVSCRAAARIRGTSGR